MINSIEHAFGTFLLHAMPVIFIIKIQNVNKLLKAFKDN